MTTEKKELSFVQTVVCLIALAAFAVLVFGFSSYLLSFTENQSKEKPVELKLPTTEQVGKATGSQVKKFGKGFLEGFFK